MVLAEELISLRKKFVELTEKSIMKNIKYSLEHPDITEEIRSINKKLEKLIAHCKEHNL